MLLTFRGKYLAPAQPWQIRRVVDPQACGRPFADGRPQAPAMGHGRLMEPGARSRVRRRPYRCASIWMPTKCFSSPFVPALLGPCQAACIRRLVEFLITPTITPTTTNTAPTVHDHGGAERRVQISRSVETGEPAGDVNGHCPARRIVQWRQIQEKAQDYSGFGLRPQTPTPKSAQLARSRPVRAQSPTAVCRNQGRHRGAARSARRTRM